MDKLIYERPELIIEVMEFNDVIMASEEPGPVPPIETQAATSAFDIGGGKETDMDWF